MYEEFQSIEATVSTKQFTPLEMAWTTGSGNDFFPALILQSRSPLTDLYYIRQLSLQCKFMCSWSCDHSLWQCIHVGTLSRYLLSCSAVDVARTPLSPAWSHAWPLIWFTFTLLWTLANFRFKGLRGFATREFHFIVLVLLASNTHQYQPTKVVLKRHWVTLKRIGWHQEGILCRTSRL